MAGYSGTPLQKKLGIKPGMRMFIIQPPEKYFDWISPLPPDITINKKLNKESSFIHLFATERKSFEKEFSRLMKSLSKDGMMWVSWPKKASKVPADLDENVIREFGLKKGLVD